MEVMRIKLELDIDIEQTSMAQLIKIVEALDSVDYHDCNLVDQNENETKGLVLKCGVCGNDSIKHSHEGVWKCHTCGKFHDANSMEKMSDAARYEREVEQ